MKTLHVHGMLLGSLLAGAATTAAASTLNHAPQPDAAITLRSQPVAIDVLANDPRVTPATLLRVQRPPAHGSAVVSERGLVYTPAAGFAGRDTFTYTVKTGRSFGLTTVTIDVVDGLTLSGRVTTMGTAGNVRARKDLRAAAAGATVSAHVGTQVFTAKVGADGAYLIDVVGLPGQVVRLESASPGVALASIVGSYGRLADEAGADGVLSVDENARVQLSPLSAALAYLLQRANDGAAVVDEAQLEAAQGAFDTAVLLEMAAAVKLVVDGAYPLPEGVADTMELISDVDAYRQFVDSVYADDPDAIGDAIAATLADSEVVPPAAESDLVGARTLLATSTPGTIRVGLVEGTRLVLEADGSGFYSDHQVAGDGGLAWQFEDGVARAVLHEPRTTESWTWRDDRQVRMIRSLHSLDVVRVLDGGDSGRDLIGLTTHYTYSYPDNPEYPDVGMSGSSTTLAHRDGVGELAFQASEFPAERALQLHREDADPGDLSASGYALHRFDADGSGLVLEAGGEAFDWSLDGAGRLLLAYDDGDHVEFRRLRDDGRKGEGVIGLFTLADGSSKSHYTMSSVRDGSLAFNDANLVNPWRSGFDVSQTAHDATGFDGFYIVLEAGGSGSQVTIFEDGTSIGPLRWDIDGGVMVVRRYRNDFGMQPECTVGVDGCHVWQERHWVPVARDGDRIYVHEELWLDPDGSGPDELRLQSQRANFYEVEAPPLP